MYFNAYHYYNVFGVYILINFLICGVQYIQIRFFR
jgi:hypothetical protein